MFKLIAETDSLAKLSDDFPSRDAALDFGRRVWSKMKRAHVRRVLLLEVSEDTCGDIEEIWREPVDPREVRVGYYGVNGKRYHVDRPTEGKFAGWTFVTTGSDYHNRNTIASVRPDGSISREHRVLDAICADPFARATEYGQITGRCAACGRKLEDPTSRRIGMGPVCRERWGV